MSLSLDSYTLLICSRKYFKGILYWCLDVCVFKKSKKIPGFERLSVYLKYWA